MSTRCAYGDCGNEATVDPVRDPMTSAETRRRHEWPVLSAASQVAGLATGSFGELQRDEEQALVDWLTWRITDGWEPSNRVVAAAYDHAVHNVAAAGRGQSHPVHRPRSDDAGMVPRAVVESGDDVTDETLTGAIHGCRLTTRVTWVPLQFGRCGWSMTYEHPGYVPGFWERLRIRIRLTATFLSYVWRWGR